MWLRLLMQFGDLLPHLSRLVPMMERVVSSYRSLASDPQGEPAAEWVDGIESLRDSNRQLLRELGDQSVQLGSIESEIKLLRQGAELAEVRAAGLEKRMTAARTWLAAASVAALLMLAVALVMLARLTAQIHGH